MSVAFRRESDEEHLEPRFERPIPAGPNFVTPRGQALIVERIAALEQAVVSAAEDDAATLNRDLRYWRARRATAVLTVAPADGSVGFATRVALRLDGAPRTVEIVGDDEAAPSRGLLAVSAPLARAMLGAEAGDVLPFNGRDDIIEVLAVTPIA